MSTALTRQHFEAIAAAVAACMPKEDDDHGIDAIAIETTCWEIAEKLADNLRHFNPLFDREKFLQACGGQL